jgi:hypothetical protein
MSSALFSISRENPAAPFIVFNSCVAENVDQVATVLKCPPPHKKVGWDFKRKVTWVEQKKISEGTYWLLMDVLSTERQGPTENWETRHVLNTVRQCTCRMVREKARAEYWEIRLTLKAVRQGKWWILRDKARAQNCDSMHVSNGKRRDKCWILGDETRIENSETSKCCYWETSHVLNTVLSQCTCRLVGEKARAEYWEMRLVLKTVSQGTCLILRDKAHDVSYLLHVLNTKRQAAFWILQL